MNDYSWAIDRLQDMRELDTTLSFDDEALELAIRSLEAWDKVREIFKAKSTSEDWEYIHDLQIWEDALEIIDKHLSELEGDA